MNNADGGVLTIDGSETDVKKDVAIIEYADGGIYSFSALQGAVDYAKPGETVKLIRDITLTENLTISGSAILNVNGKNVTGKFELQDGATLTAVAGLDVITNVEGKAVSYNGTAYVLVDGYKVTFNSNSGSAVAAVNVVSGTAVSAPANPTRTGYTFGGWYTDEACTNAYNFETLVTGDITLYAKWTQNQTSRPSSKPTTTAPTTPSEPTISTDDKTEENAAGDKVTTTETTVKPETTVTGTTAKTEISESVADKIVEEATKSESSSVVIAPEVSETKDVDKVEVTIAASTVDKIGNDTTANLTVSTPVADVAISNEGLTELAGEKEAVTVSAEKKEDDTITVEVKSGDKAVSNVSGGLTVTVPVEETSAGMVAVIVHEDGTEEVVRQTVAGDDALEIPLDGSATIKIVDNSKDFEDVNEDDWHNDAVDFASSRELFNGTSATTFGPTENMTRGMLAVVLHNLESNPEHEHEEDFHDVHDQRYYADAVAWAAGEGLVSGYGNGAYGPDDHITRQQLAVILWKYAGCPDSDHELDFHDEADIADYAEAALKWANEHKIINGKGEGKLDPTGNATRAEVAQMLKNFMENVK
ncbi:MAG: S-layer homology domain-containing protein [Firmicutes bacterium]|nr:S-layer homology domain-containing protein [Bacillota bacterium]